MKRVTKLCVVVIIILLSLLFIYTGYSLRRAKEPLMPEDSIRKSLSSVSVTSSLSKLNKQDDVLSDGKQEGVLNPGCIKKKLNQYRPIDTGRVYHHPSIIHYAKLTRGQDIMSVNFREYTSVLSVHKFLHPERIIFHTYTGIAGKYWDMIREWKDVGIEVHKIDPVRRIGGKSVPWIQHEADYVKLRELLHHGGITMDFDVVIVNATRLRREQRLSECVISEEGDYINGGFHSCVKDSPYIRKWLEGYDHDYRPHLWLHNVSFKPTTLLTDKNSTQCYNLYLDDTICIHPNWGKKREWLNHNGVQWRTKTLAHYFVKRDIHHDDERLLQEDHSLAELLRYVHEA